MTLKVTRIRIHSFQKNQPKVLSVDTEITTQRHTVRATRKYTSLSNLVIKATCDLAKFSLTISIRSTHGTSRHLKRHQE